MTQITPPFAIEPVALDQFQMSQPARIIAVDWQLLSIDQARRLREMGFDEGVIVELLHQGPYGGDPLACLVGRMTVAIRRDLAHFIKVVAQEVSA